MIIVLQNFHNMIRNQFSVKIKRFWSDSTRDYFNQCLTSYSQHERIIHESSCVNTLQQNGVAKRKNGHFLYTTQVFLFQKRVSKSYWGEVVLTATHLNRLPSRILGFKCPMKIISTFYLNMRTINHPIPKIFGCMCHLCMFIVKIRENWIQEQLNVLFSDILQLKSDIRVTTHHPKFCPSWCYLQRSESYFPTSYLQGENSIKEDKDWDSCFIDPFLIELPKVSDPVSIPSFSEPKSPIEPIVVRKDWMIGKVCWRKKVVVSGLIQVQESEPTSKNELTISHPPLQTQSEF